MLAASDALEYAKLRLARLKLAERLEQEPKYDWYGPDCGCPDVLEEDGGTRGKNGACKLHPRARPSQHPPAGDWQIWYCEAGRGWGKTQTITEYARHQVQK